MSTPAIIIDISVTEEKWNAALPELETFVHAVTYAVLEHQSVSSTEVSFSFVNDGFMQGLNKQYRDKDKPTNVLSFPLDNTSMLGDVVLALETIKTEAKEQHKKFEDHVCHLLVHGLLHLLGYDHIDDKEAETMESLEITVLEKMNVKNPYETGNFMS